MSVGPANKKQYGLIIPKNKEKAPIKKRPISSVFNLDSDEEDGAPEQRAPSFKNMKRQAKIDIHRALEDDPTVYQYDEVYDKMKQEKLNLVTAAKRDKTSKYAKHLLRNAAIRKLENDRHFERQCQKELEDEGDEFADKESFITSSYKNKLAELAELEEEHKRMEEEEKKNDVTKKADLTDFYRDILSRRTETPKAADATKTSANNGKSLEKAPVAVSDAISELKVTDSAKTQQKVADNLTAPPQNQQLVIKKASSGKRRYRGHTKTNITQKTVETDSGNSSDEGDKSEKPNEENPDRDDSNDTSDSGEDENEESTKKDGASTKNGEESTKKDEETVMTVDVPKVKLTEAEEKEAMLKLIREKFKRRNTPETIQSAIERYWQRQSTTVS